MYVWFDALINYLSGVAGSLGHRYWEESKSQTSVHPSSVRLDWHNFSKDGIYPEKPLSRFWPANMHVVGKAGS